MTAMLWRFARFNELRQEAQAHPPRRPLGQPGEGVGGERHPGGGADALRQAACFAHTREDRLGLLHTGGGEGFAPKQEAAVAIGDGQRMPASCVEERRHHVVRCVAGRRVWPTRALFEALRAVRARAVDPCVRSLAADLIERAELGDGEAITQLISDELGFLVQG